MSLETVLVALGANDSSRSDRILDTVVDIVGPADARVVLLHVFSDDEFGDVAERLEFDPAEATPEAVAGRHSTVREVGNGLDAAGIEYEVRGGVGDKGRRIVDAAEEADADLVFVGGRQRSPAGKAVFGSTAQEVLLDSPVPVVFVQSK